MEGTGMSSFQGRGLVSVAWGQGWAADRWQMSSPLHGNRLGKRLQ